MSQHNRHCFANHMGVWAIETRFFLSTLAAIKAGTIVARSPIVAMEDDDAPPRKIPPFAVALAAEPVTDTNRNVLYFLTGDGVAIVEIHGALMKTAGKYADTGTIDVRRALRAAIADERVVAIMLHIDSPGGAASGTAELAAEITAARESKPVSAHIDDMGASAAYWVASAAGKVTANAMGEVGSIGVYSVLFDQSEQYKAEGVEAIIIGSGDMKGAGYPGTKVTEEQKTYFQGLVDNVNAFFAKAVAKNRQLTDAQVRAVNTGRVYPSAQAKDLGLIDQVATFERAVADLALSGRQAKRASRREAMQARLDLDQAE
jgi:signal peptide peptidase SppA